MRRLFLTKKNEVYGIDVSRTLLERAKKNGLKVLFHNIDEKDDLPFPKDYFDFIFLVEVVEHTFCPQRLFKKCYRVLKPEGKIYMTIPNGLKRDKKKYIQETLERDLKRIYKNKIPEGAKRFPDFNIITIYEIRRILKKVGFRIRELHGWKWKWEELNHREKLYFWNNPLKARDLLIVISKKL
jgi:SAM-dependent methyltransferase